MKKFVKNLLFTAALCLIIYVTLLAVTWLVAVIMRALLGERIAEPVWTSVYQAISYTLALTLLLFVPKLIKSLEKLLQKLLKKKSANHKKSSKTAKKKSLLARLADLLARDPLTLAKKPTRDGLGLTGLPTWTDIGLAPIAFVASLIVSQALLALFSLFPWFNATETQAIGYSTAIFGFDRLLAFVSLCVIAPIAEELIFRGWLYGKQRLKTGAIFAILINAIFFGVMHGQWNVALTVGAMGAASCFLREITGTAYSGILLHILKNSIAFILLFVYGL